MCPDQQPAVSTIKPALLFEVMKGDQQALASLYDVSGTLLYSLALRIVGTREEAAKTLQQVYLDVWKKVVRYDVSRGTPIAWLIAVTRNRALDRVRGRGLRPTRHLNNSPHGSPPDQPLNHSPASLNAPADQALRNTIVTALAALSPVQREAIEWAYYGGLSLSEIAVKVGCSSAAVRTCLTLAMTTLREALQQHEESRRQS
ncbi:MAG: sigma-70 family RNA polymerase sigma factor [Nitrospira sp.]|nr:sigma-70 family RNA polymerase sigma factor [Nitrospira sp.]